jgi:hypothetical protein
VRATAESFKVAVRMTSNDSEIAAGAVPTERPERFVELGVVHPREREQDRSGVREAVDIGEVSGERTVVQLGGTLQEGAADGLSIEGGATGREVLNRFRHADDGT